MKNLILFLIVVSFACCSCSFYNGLNGTVVDNATGQPLEGALVVVQWTKPRGIPGLQYRDLHKIAETLTDKQGAFSIDGTIGFLLDPPEMLIYKDGYIPWRNDMDFPGGHRNKDNEWKHNITYRLDIFTDKYTYRQLYHFLDTGMMGNSRKEVPMSSKLMRDISMREKAEIRTQMQKNNKP